MAGKLGGRKQRKQLLQFLNDDERYSVFVEGGGLICPYCREVTTVQKNDRAWQEKITKHFAVQCRVFEEVVPPPTRLGELKQLKHSMEGGLRLKTTIKQDPAWRVLDRDGVWYCPCCAKPTSVTYAGPEKNSAKLLADILKHLKTCFEYNQNPVAAKTAPELKAMIIMAQKEESLTRMISGRIADGDEAFIQKSPAEKWLCPYCMQEITRISIATELLLKANAPVQIATHLIHECPVDISAEEPQSAEAVKALAADMRQAELEKRITDAESKPEESAYVANLRKEMLAFKEEMGVNDELKKSLDKARDVVARMLPAEIPQLEGYEIETFFQSCSQVGGDFYDFIALDDGKLAIVMGDVSGHGLEAALVMGMVKKAINVRAAVNPDPHEVLVRANGDVYPDLERNTFCTVFLGAMDPLEHSLEICRAGHNFALVYKHATGEVLTIKSGGMSVGISSGAVFEKALEKVSFVFEPGDIFLQYTDGLTEAMNAEGEEMGIEQLESSLMLYAREDAAAIIDNIMQDTEAFMSGFPQQDDISLVLIRRLADDT